jgi:hypothetical protein
VRSNARAEMTILDEHTNRSEVAPLDGTRTVPTEVLFAEARHRRRRRWLVAGVFSLAAALIAAATFVGLAFRTPVIPAHGLPPSATTSLRPPSAMVVVAANGDLDVISESTGRTIRKLADGVGLFRGNSQPTVSRSGLVYFDNGTQFNGGPSEEIFSVPVSGGSVRFVAFGHMPVVSPDGTMLAYEKYTDHTDTPDSIVTVNLVSGATETWIYGATQKPYPASWPNIGDLSWSSDSRSLAFTGTATSGNTSTYGAWSLLISKPDRSLLHALRIPLQPGAYWEGFVSPTEGIEVQVQSNFLGQGDWFRPIIVDFSTGRVVRSLPKVFGQSGLGGIGGGWQVDSTGRFLAFSVSRTLPNGSGSTFDLYRWNIGASAASVDPRPVMVKRSVATEAWIPPH